MKNQVRVLSDILDEIHEELQWVTRNGLPIREPMPACPTLKRMAFNPSADDWSDRLVIDYGTSSESNAPSDSRDEEAGPPPAAGTPAGKPSPGKLLSEYGDQRKLF